MAIDGSTYLIQRMCEYNTEHMVDEELNQKKWQQMDFFERLDWCARDVSKNGFGIQGWVLSIAYLRFLVFNLLFLLLLYHHIHTSS